MARKGQGIEILSGWQEGLGGEDFLRELVQRTVQQVLEAEMTSFLGAETYQRNDQRRGWRFTMYDEKTAQHILEASGLDLQRPQRTTVALVRSIGHPNPPPPSLPALPWFQI